MTLPLASRISKEQVQTDQLFILYMAWSKFNFFLLLLPFTVYVQHSRALIRKSTEQALNKCLQNKRTNTNGKLAPIWEQIFFSMFTYYRKELSQVLCEACQPVFVFTFLKSKHFIKNVFGMPMMFCLRGKTQEYLTYYNSFLSAVMDFLFLDF